MISYENKKTRLRPIKKSDMEKSIQWRNDPDTRENALGYRLPVTEKMEDKWYESALDDQSRTRVIFAVESLGDGALIGFTHLNRIDWIARVAHFGIIIGDRESRGKGMGPDAMEILFNYAFELLNLRKICLEVASFNEKAIGLYRRFGFKEEGVLKEQIFLEGSYHDVVLMRLFDSEFRKSHAGT